MQQLLIDRPWIIMLILLWSLPWKGVALWISARRGHIGWFIALMILNTLAILDILYIFIFSKWNRKAREKNQEDPRQGLPKPNLKTIVV